MSKSRDNSKSKKFSDEELSQILKNVRENRALFLASSSSTNAAEKGALWQEISEDVNSVSLATRETTQIKKRWSDWVYTTKKKNLSSMDKELVEFLKAESPVMS
jgi:type I restriction-modification system DNA methylase subunit